jgi:hypothetical protein
MAALAARERRARLRDRRAAGHPSFRTGFDAIASRGGDRDGATHRDAGARGFPGGARDSESAPRVAPVPCRRAAAGPSCTRRTPSSRPTRAARSWISSSRNCALPRSRLLPARTTPRFRTSRTCDLSDSDSAVARLDQKIYSAIGFDKSLAEPTQGQHYEVGQVFKTHTDFFKPYELEKYTMGALGQRTWTFMIYLNEPAGGGETEFPDLGVKVAPKLGRAGHLEQPARLGRGQRRDAPPEPAGDGRHQDHHHQVVPDSEVIGQAVGAAYRL